MQELIKVNVIVNGDFTGCKVFNALAKQELQDYFRPFPFKKKENKAGAN